MKFLTGSFCALALASCASGGARYGGSENLKIVQTSELPVPSIVDLQASDRPYRVGPFDKLTIDVFGSAELSKKEVQVDASGRITFPLIGTIEVAGNTPGNISKQMQDLLRGRYIRDPHVSVNLQEIFSQRLTIGGEVKKPGVYPIIGKITLLTAIASAEGWTDISHKGEVVVYRKVKGQDYAVIFDVRGIERGNYPDPELYASDTVIVGESGPKKVWKGVLAASPLIGPVIFALAQTL